ncbi:OmpP1/FadL family transporter [Hyphomicrobium sp.]|uniref:OmpP1/FadL family transporter n=1 Tax=Hyphomicrobium sp. TaxID=82 RepID=UPI002D79040C|nr:outer membrane protein transport protein [Hyphomicrobium sp.]HET6388014.1 outer membrane protein transport protein [Hyphomicrobium sp.]
MRNFKSRQNVFRLAAAGLAASAACSSAATAGGFDIHEQSTVFLGSASAGAAAGGSLGSMFWNPAATAQFPGLNSESSYTLILPDANIDINSPLAGNSGNIGIDAVASASYGAYQVSKDVWVGIAINSPFGLASKPENVGYPGSYLGVTTKLLTINANPTIAYRIAPGITIGAGVQIEWAQGKLQFRESPDSIAQFGGTDWAFGGTAGITIEPRAGTTIGLGYRSQMTHELEGTFHSDGITSGFNVPGTAKVNLPDIVTLSARQEITPTTRLLGTVEWKNWSVFKQLPLDLPGGNQLALDTNWHDGWFFSVGGEYDYSPVLTLRSGVAYEISPIRDASERIVQIPDNDRVWLSIGASYKWSDSITLDAGYSHIFVQDGGISRSPATFNGFPTGPTFNGTVEASIDLFSVGVRTKW